MSDVAAGSPSPEPTPPPPATDGPSSSPAAAPAVGASASGQGAVQVIQQGSSSAGTANYINQQNVNNLRIVSKYFEGESMAVERPFTASEDAKCLTGKVAVELTETFVGDGATMQRLLGRLEERRVLLLTGDRDVGKRTAALYLAVRMAREKKFESDPLLVDALERHIAVNLRDIAADAPSFGKRTTVFADAFEQRNTQLRSFFANADQVGWDQLTELLRKNDAYFIFTSTSASVPFGQQSTDRIAQCELHELGEELIREGIGKRLEWMTSAETTSGDRIALLSENRTRIVAELKTLAEIVSFLRHFVREESDLETSLRRFRDASLWLRTALERDIDAWTFALALTLTQPLRNAESAPWADFERIRRAVAERIRTDVELFPKRRKPEEGDESDVLTPSRSFSDDVVLERCRAVISKDSSRLGDVVRFEHPALAAQLWDTLMTRYRRILMLVLPVLRRIAEDDVSEWSLRVLAAQAIGRMGEIDPARITLPIIHRWAVSGDHALRPLVGRVMQGVLASANENYRNLALRNIDWLADVKATANEEEAKDGVLTAISAYAAIGEYEPFLAMARLGAVVTDYLAPLFGDLHKSEREVETVVTALSQVKSPSNRVAELQRRTLQFSRFLTNIGAEHAPALLAVGQAISQLCLAHDTVPILRATRDWIAKGGSPTGVLVALLFLNGISLRLQALPAGIRAMTGASGSPLLQSLGETRDAVHHFCSFLADVHASINTTFHMPAWMQHQSRERFAECLTTWAREAVANRDHRQRVQDVFTGLTVARRGSMRRDILAVLESTAFTDSESMRAFAAEVRKGMDA